MEKIEKSPDDIVKQSVIGRFLQKLKNWLSDIIKNKGKIEKFIRDVNQGKFKNLDNNSQNTLKSEEKPLTSQYTSEQLKLFKLMDINPEIEHNSEDFKC